jgi:hypothetical protein
MGMSGTELPGWVPCPFEVRSMKLRPCFWSVSNCAIIKGLEQPQEFDMKRFSSMAISLILLTAISSYAKLNLSTEKVHEFPGILRSGAS